MLQEKQDLIRTVMNIQSTTSQHEAISIKDIYRMMQKRHNSITSRDVVNMILGMQYGEDGTGLFLYNDEEKTVKMFPSLADLSIDEIERKLSKEIEKNEDDLDDMISEGENKSAYQMDVTKEIVGHLRLNNTCLVNTLVNEYQRQADEVIASCQFLGDNLQEHFFFDGDEIRAKKDIDPNVIFPMLARIQPTAAPKDNGGEPAPEESEKKEPEMPGDLTTFGTKILWVLQNHFKRKEGITYNDIAETLELDVNTVRNTFGNMAGSPLIRKEGVRPVKIFLEEGNEELDTHELHKKIQASLEPPKPRKRAKRPSKKTEDEPVQDIQKTAQVSLRSDSVVALLKQVLESAPKIEIKVEVQTGPIEKMVVYSTHEADANLEEKVQKLHESGKKSMEIAEKLDIPRVEVLEILSKHGLI